MQSPGNDQPTLLSDPPMVWTGVNASGAPIKFRQDVPPFTLVNIQFLVSYTRTTPQGAFVLDFSGNIAPNNAHMRINSTVVYLAGDVTAVYLNEAKALVAAGVAAWV